MSYTGWGEVRETRPYPPVINILSSDKQYKAFGDDAKNITVGMYGKLFIRKRDGNNKLSDLVSKLVVVPLKVEMGHDVYMLVEGLPKFVGGEPRMIKAVERNDWLAKHQGMEYRNIVKVLVAPYTNDIEKVKKMLELAEKGEMPFAMLTFKGSSWKSWFELKKKADKLTTSAPDIGRPAMYVPLSRFKWTVESEFVKDGSKEYYVPKVTPELINGEIAMEYQKLVLWAKDFPLFRGIDTGKANNDSAQGNEEVPTVDIEDIAKDVAAENGINIDDSPSEFTLNDVANGTVDAKKADEAVGGNDNNKDDEASLWEEFKV